MECSKPENGEIWQYPVLTNLYNKGNMQAATGRVTWFQLSLELSHKAQVEYCTESAKTFIWVFHVTKKLEWMFWPTQYDLPFIALSIYT